MIFPKQRYQCIQCGKSCGQWRIWVEPDLVDSLRRHPLALRLQVAGQPYLVEHEGGWHHLGYDKNGRCFFLEGERRCGLHASTGWLSKPRACRQFPFFLVETPDGTQVGLSFRCSAVQQNLGVDWEQHRNDLEQLAGSGAYRRVGFEATSMGPVRLEWRDYLGWEASWREQLLRGFCLRAIFYHHLVTHLGLELAEVDFARLVQNWTLSALALLQTPLELAELKSNGESIRYFEHVLERKWLWLGENFLGRMLLLLVGEQLYWSAGDKALDLVEGEWLGHREDLGPVEHGLADTMLQFCHR
ncbi:MAG: YkgJ family cysteine cluster protein [Candidatus Eremiobacteraeota bacterium]|nr:YkgJ family cysteine cluster protein [Candidatus Eremiobacteraeota bacterium]MCW5869475.1 YkgJ family cysteine cluster protein [Candidatus Eremiobacteraeota bacterium]